MTDVKHIKKKLENFGLSQKQAEIYILLLRQGSLRINEIVKFLDLPRSSVYEHLRSLFDLGLAEEMIENNYKLIAAYPIGSIKHRIDEQVIKLHKQAADLEYLERALNVLPSIKLYPATTIRYYKGKSGAQQLFWNTLKAKNTIYVYSEWGRGRYVGINFYKKFVEESYARGFKEHVLTNPLPSVLSSIRQHAHTPVSRTELNNIRTVDSKVIKFKGDTLMYDNIYAQIFLKDERISGFEIESKQFLDTQRAIFNTLWEQAKPISDFLS